MALLHGAGVSGAIKSLHESLNVVGIPSPHVPLGVNQDPSARHMVRWPLLGQPHACPAFHMQHSCVDLRWVINSWTGDGEDTATQWVRAHAGSRDAGVILHMSMATGLHELSSLC